MPFAQTDTDTDQELPREKKKKLDKMCELEKLFSVGIFSVSA